jgi:hypothetical protein
MLNKVGTDAHLAKDVEAVQHSKLLMNLSNSLNALAGRSFVIKSVHLS